jgi:hypothetical protein
VASDGVNPSGFLAPSVFNAQRITLGSFHGADNTGLFTALDLDDVVLGPAVGATPPVFTPQYFSPDGIAAVRYAVRSGGTPYSELASTNVGALTWRDTTNATRTVVDLAGLPDGVARVFLKARSTSGVESAVTDLPFLLDRAPPVATAMLVESEDPQSNGTKLRVGAATTGGAPLDPESLRLSWDGTARALEPYASTFAHAGDSETLDLNWPYLFRTELDASADGQKHTIQIAGLQDGAGNRAADLAVPVVVNYKQDKVPPTLLPTEYPTNILWTAPWEKPNETYVYFEAALGINPHVVRGERQPPFLRNDVANNVGEIAHTFESPKWLLASHPWLAFQMRRPAFNAAEKTAIWVDLEFDPTNRYVVPLTAGLEGKSVVGIGQAVTWKSNEWVSFTLDLRELLKAPVGEAKLAQVPVKRLRIAVTNAPERAVFDLRGVYVFAPWGPQDRIRMAGYDASGTGGPVLEPYQSDAAALIASPTLRGVGAWWQMQLVDKAGNRSTPIFAPVFGASRPADPLARKPPR